jgi:preprotein translocase subunit YajC
MLFSIALAEGVATQAQGSSILSFAPLVVLLVVFYFFILRPQQKKAKQEAQMRNSIQIGDKIVTTSGVFGSVTAIDDTKGVISIEVAKDISIVVYKASIAETLTKNDNDKNQIQGGKK